MAKQLDTFKNVIHRLLLEQIWGNANTVRQTQTKRSSVIVYAWCISRKLTLGFHLENKQIKLCKNYSC